MTPILVASLDDVVEQLVFQAWVHRARGGDRAGARSLAERTVERLLSRGLPHAWGPSGRLLLDPYGASNAVKARRGEAADEAWADWVETARTNATCLPSAPHRYRFRLRREWHVAAPTGGRPVVVRLPLPLRGALARPPEVRLIEPAGASFHERVEEGRVELRIEAGAVHGFVAVELVVELVAGEVREVTAAESPAEEAVWLRRDEGMMAASGTIDAFAASLPGGPESPRELAAAAFDRLLGVLRLGDVHRQHLAPDDRIGGLLESAWVDCALGATLLVAICRARGVPARVVSGFLLHVAVPAPHYWAEVRVAPGTWVPYDLGTWDYCAGDPADSEWGGFFRGRVDARFVAEVAPRQFTGWGSAKPPEHWFRLQALLGEGVQHHLRALPTGAPAQRDELFVEIVGPAAALAGSDPP